MFQQVAPVGFEDRTDFPYEARHGSSEHLPSSSMGGGTEFALRMATPLDGTTDPMHENDFTEGFAVGVNEKGGFRQWFPRILEGALSGIHTSVELLTTLVQLLLNRQLSRGSGESPMFVRLLCFLGGLTMLISGVTAFFNIFMLLTSPSAYILHLYRGMFGMTIMVIEAKDWEAFERVKPWLEHWFRFLTVPGGKGAFYLFIGSLGLSSVWSRSVFSIAVGLYMSAMGLLCLSVQIRNMIYAKSDASFNPNNDQSQFAPYMSRYQSHRGLEDEEDEELDEDIDDDDIDDQRTNELQTHSLETATSNNEFMKHMMKNKMTQQKTVNGGIF